MKKKGQAVSVEIQDTRTGKVTSGEIWVLNFDKPARWKRAFKFGAFCWGLAIASVLIPIAHFVLVPLFLLAGPLVFGFILDEKSLILGGLGICPGCGKSLPLVATRTKAVLRDVCAECQCEVTISTKTLSAQ